MRVIFKRTDSRLGNAFGILILCSLAGFILWWGWVQDRFLLPVGLILSVPCPYASYRLARNIRHPVTCVLGTEAGFLLWVSTRKDCDYVATHKVPLHSVRSLELIFRTDSGEGKCKDYGSADVYIADAQGTRHVLPFVLHPGIYHKRILSGIQQEVPGLKLVERFGDPEEATRYVE
jgi:hypothetical protein